MHSRRSGLGAGRRAGGRWPGVRSMVLPLGMVLILVALAVGSASSARTPGRISWIVTIGELQRLRALDPALAMRVFDAQTTFALSAAGAPAHDFGRALPTAVFADEQTLARAVNDRELAPGARAVIYDDEHWPLTPLTQQQDPALYYRRAAQVAHQHVLLLIATPAADLVSVLAPGTPKVSAYSEFLKLGIAGAAARYADVYDVQAQGSEAALSAYTAFVRAAANQARTANPHVKVLAGIATNPDRQRENARGSRSTTTGSYGSTRWASRSPGTTSRWP
jgi:hypothetical protein